MTESSNSVHCFESNEIICWATDTGNHKNLNIGERTMEENKKTSDVSYLTKSYQPVKTTPYAPENDLS